MQTSITQKDSIFNRQVSKPVIKLPSVDDYKLKPLNSSSTPSSLLNKPSNTSSLPSVDKFKMDTNQLRTQELGIRQGELDFKNRELDANGFGANMSTANFTLSAGTDLLNAWSTFKQLGLQEDSFKFNKDMATKNYNMAKESYDRRKERSQRIGSVMSEGR